MNFFLRHSLFILIVKSSQYIIKKLKVARIIKIEMLRKKNYKQEDHFTQFHTFTIPLQTGKRIIVYYKRYRPKITVTEKVGEIYDLINKNKNNKKPEQNQYANSPYPVDRTVEFMTFDEELKGKIEPILKKVGKIRKFQFGKGEFKNREIFFCMAIFKYEFDLVKCFRDDYIQTIIQEEFKFHQNQQDKDDYRSQMIETYLKNELESKNKKIKELHDEGYNLITKKTGDFKVDRENNEKWVEDLPQIKKKKKLQQKAADFKQTKLE